MDRATVDAILGLNPISTIEQACGAMPVNGMMRSGAQAWPAPVVLDLRNSGDTAGDPDRVVGYAAFAFEARPEQSRRDAADPDQPNAEKGTTLLKLARNAIASKLGQPAVKPRKAAWLQEPGATFVTLTRQGELRGCIGSLEAHRPLGLDVRENALAAAFRDPRFAPLTRGELAATRVEVSLLSPTEPIAVKDEAAVRRSCGRSRRRDPRERPLSRHLPAAGVGATARTGQFMSQLKRKAGLSRISGPKQVRLSRYTVSKW